MIGNKIAGALSRMPKNQQNSQINFSVKDKNYLQNGQRGDWQKAPQAQQNNFMKLPLSMKENYSWQKPQMPKVSPMMMGQGDNYFPGIHNQQFAQQAQMRGDLGGQPPALQNPGRYAGFESNYFPQSRMNMPQNLNAGTGQPQGALPNMGMAQGYPGNYFPQAQMNNPFIRR